MNPIKPEDLFSTDFTEKLDDIIAKLETAMGTLNTKMEGVKTTARSLSNVKFSGTAAEDTRKWANSVLALNDEYRYLLSQFNVTKSTIAELTTVERDQNQILKLQQQYAEAATGSFNKMSAEYRLLKIAMNAINQEAVGNTDAFKKLQKRTEELYDTMNKYQKSTGKFTMQVGDYSRALNGLQLSTQQVLREMPTLANSLQQFFIAISNNVPIFVDNFKRARQEMGSFSAALKGTIGAIFSWQTALLVLLTVLPKIAKAIRDKKKAQEESNKETKEAFDREKELLSLQENIAKAEQKSVAQLQALYSITQDVTRSEKERMEAAEALQRMYPERLANLSQEEILAGNAKTAIDDLTNSLVLQATARGYLNEIEKLSEQAAQKQIAIARERGKLTQQETELATATARAQREGRATVSRGTTGGFVTTTAAGAAEREAQDAVDTTKAVITTLDSELQDLENTIDDVIKLIPTSGLLETIVSGKGGRGRGGAREKEVGAIPDFIIEYYEALIAGMEDGLTKQSLQLDKEGLELGREREKEWATLAKKEEIARANGDKAALAQIAAAYERYAMVYEQGMENIRQKRAALFEGDGETALTDPLADVRKAYWDALVAQRDYTKQIQQGIDEGRTIGQEELKGWQVTIKKRLEAEAEFQKAKKVLELKGMLDAGKITQEEYEMRVGIVVEETDAALRKAIDKIGKKRGKRWNIWTALFGTDVKDEATGTISRILGEDVKYGLDQTMNAYKSATKYVDEYIDALARQAEQAVATAETEKDMARQWLDAELEARANGYANSVDLAWKEYNERKKAQEQAQRDAERYQRLQLAMESASQAANLVTATTGILKSYSALPLLGQALAVAGIAAMWTTFLAAKAKAAQVTRYGEGMSEYLDYGGSHASGNDIDFGVGRDGRRRRVERGEVIGVIRKRNVRKYGASTVTGIIDSLNRGDFEYKYGNAFSPAIINGGGTANLSRLERGVDALVQQGEYRETTQGGRRVIRYKNLTRRIQ